MLEITTPQIVLIVYGVLLGLGGLMGYLKAGSRPSLVAGSTSGLIAVLTAMAMRNDFRAIWLGVALAAAMLVVFTIRLRKTRKFMPSGLLVGASLVVLAILLIIGVLEITNKAS